MNKYTVVMLGDKEVEIHADKVMITANGDLKFDTQHGDFVAAYAAGQWIESWQEEVPEDAK
jgi:hypothetical protein